MTLTCDLCGATLAFQGALTEICPFCRSPNFLRRPPAADQPTPRFVVPFAGDASWARTRLKRWLRTRWFADGRLLRAPITEMRGVYLPAYVFSAVARTDFTAQIGELYKDVETRTRIDPATGLSHTEQREVTKTEYRPLAGQHVQYVTDVVISASTALSQAELARVEPFDLRALRRWSPKFVSGFVQEAYARSLDECRRASRVAADDHVEAGLRRFMPGDSYSDLDFTTQLTWESLDPLLVPVWVFVVRYRTDRPPLRVLVNGQTGRIGGEVPRAPWKVGLAIAVALLVLLLVVWQLRGGTP